jgi:hypothetical protein
LKNQALCQYKYGSLYHVIQLPVMTSDWKRMNKSVVNNVYLKKNCYLRQRRSQARVQKEEGYASGM